MQKDENNIDNMINDMFKNITDIAKNNIVIGNIVNIADNIYVIPVNKISVGIVSGEFELYNKKHKNNSSIGNATGFNIFPIGFVCLTNGVLNYLNVNECGDSKKLIDLIFKMYDYISNTLDSGDDNV